MSKDIEYLKDVAPGIYKQMKSLQYIEERCNVEEVAEHAWNLCEALKSIKDEYDRELTLGHILQGIKLVVKDAGE